MNKPLSQPEILKGATILVVDSDRDNRNLYAFLLADQGARVISCKSIQDALNSLDRQIPGLVVCEINFPGESVHPLIQRVEFLALGLGRIIPVLVTSTCPAVSFAERNINAEAYLLKPIDVADFVNRIWNLIFLPSIRSSLYCLYSDRN